MKQVTRRNTGAETVLGGIRARRKAERPGEILEAAFEEFVLKGYAATRLEDVAARAGVTKGTIYFYFDSKETLFASTIRELSKPTHAALAEDESDLTDDIRDYLKGYLNRLYRFIVDDQRSRELLRLLIAEAGRFPELVDEHCQACMDPVIERLRVRLEGEAAHGRIRPVSLPEVAEVVLGPALALNIMLLMFANRRPLDAEKFVAAHLDLVLHGLLPGS